MTYADAVSSAIKEEMLKDKYLTIIGEDIGKYGGVFKATKGLYEQFGDGRVKDTPISEAAIMGIAIGSSLIGYKVIVEIMYIDFLTIASDQIINHAAKIHYMSGGKLNVPIVIRTQGGAGIRNAAQHSQSLEAWFMHIPGLKVVMPSSPYDAKGLLKSAIKDNNPVIFIEHKKLYVIKGEVPESDYFIKIGEADIKKEGKDITIICNAFMVLIALQAAEILDKEHGISCEIIDLRSISPLDKDAIIKSVKKTNRAVILHEACEQGGISGEITSIIQKEAFDYHD
ncbi:MAG: alpha-ketoacid dehydrogenase subunit beta, partial [Actinobacteria bacterium]|nr:alpha-ketoacid dehydrogenase subunit beta [Actinomycetota bacterium]